MISIRLDVVRCEEVADRLSEFLDGELDTAKASRVARHLAACAACARVAAELAATILALHRLPRPQSGASCPPHRRG